MDRRRFIQTGLIGVAASLIPWRLPLAANPKSVVWEAKALPQDAVKALLAAIGGIKSLLKNDAARASVLVKPNLCLPHPAKQATASSAEMIEAVCAALVAAGVRKITIADHTLQKTQAFEKAEFRKISEKYPEVKIVLANEQRLYEPVEVPGKVLRQTEVLKIALRSDLVINLATAKHHAATDVSLATKNLMGLIWDRAAFHTKMDLDQAIGDLALAVRPHLNIVDASRVLLTGGPTGPGKILEDGRVFASRDMLAVDAVVASRYNLGEKTLVPGNIGHLRAAYRGGVGEINADRIQVEKAAAAPQ